VWVARTLACLITVSGTGVVTAHAGVSFVKNGSFESFKDGRAANWRLNGNAQLSSVPGIRPKTRAVVLELASEERSANISQAAVKLSIPKGTTLELSAHYRTEDMFRGDKPHFSLGAKLNYYSKRDRQHLGVSLPPSDDWKFVSSRIKLKHDVVDFQLLYNIAHCRGRFFLDEVSLRIVNIKGQLTLFSLKKPSPLVDGKLDDACWEGAQQAVGFMPLGKVEGVEPPTEVMSVYDDEFLYFAAKAHEPDVANITGNRSAPWRGDGFEFFVGPAQSETHYQFVINCKGDVYTGQHTSQGHKRYDSALRVGIHRDADFWALEIAIPFAEMGVSVPEDNQRWAFNVARNQAASGTSRNFTWAALGAYTEWTKLGKLAFYSRADIDADMEYWKNSDVDPLMRKGRVSGFETAQGRERRVPDLWTYFPFDADRGKPAKNGYFYGQGLSTEFRAEHREFHDAGMRINSLLIEKSRLDKDLRLLKRVAFYGEQANLKRAWFEFGKAPSLQQFQSESDGINVLLNAAFQHYGAAFSADRSVEKLSGIRSELSAIETRMAALGRGAAAAHARLRARMRRRQRWRVVDLTYADGGEVLNEAGLNQRLQFVWKRFADKRKAQLMPLLPGFSAIDVDWPYTIPDNAKTAATPEDWVLDDRLPKSIEVRQRSGIAGISLNPTLAVHQIPGSEDFLSRLAADPDIINTSADGHRADYKGQWWRAFGTIGATNVNNPVVLAQAERYVAKLAGALKRQGILPVFFLSTWEGNYPFYIDLKDPNRPGYRQHRLPGYNPSQKQAFRDYLAERYPSVDALNRNWRSDYASFAEIAPPPDRNIKPAPAATGLTYEFERFMRVNFVRYQAKLRALYRKYLPGAKVLPDPSTFIAEMNAYLMYKENACDYMGFHSNVSLEEPMWAYLSTMNRVFGKVTGHYENYHGYYRRAHLNDERLARRDLRKLFFTLFMRDVRLSTWWIRYSASPSSYTVAYNGNACMLDYDQTIYRWSTTALPVMFTRGRAIEKALVGSAPERPVTAIIQPCATIFNLASMGEDHKTSPTIRMMFELHNSVLRPKNLAHDYLPEEMVLDGHASLDDYGLLFLPYAPYLSAEFAKRLSAWVKNGGTLIGFGPFGLMDQYGAAMPEGASLFKQLFPDYRQTGDGYFAYTLTGGPDQDEPGITKKPFGKGQLIHLNRMSSVYTQNAALKTEFDQELSAFDALKTADPASKDLKLLVRKSKQGDDLYLCICNKNVEAPVTADVSVRGAYRQALDITVPGWFPAPATASQDKTVVAVRLEPGEWTMIQLSK